MLYRVKAHPRARRVEIRETGPNSLEIWLREAPENNRANDALIALIAKHLGVPKSSVSLRSGHTSRTKMFAIRELVGRGR